MSEKSQREEELERENKILKERLYRVHTVDHPEVKGCLAGIIHPDALEVYDQRAQFRGEATKQTLRASELEGLVGLVQRDRDKFLAVALKLWRDLGHDPETEPLPEVHP